MSDDQKGEQMDQVIQIDEARIMDHLGEEIWRHVIDLLGATPRASRAMGDP
jgi:hypothetical protein